MPDQKKEKIKRFVQDIETERAVHGALLRFFLKSPKERDVQSLAAAWMAKEIFDDAWKEILKLRNEIEQENKNSGNVGV